MRKRQTFWAERQPASTNDGCTAAAETLTTSPTSGCAPVTQPALGAETPLSKLPMGEK